MEMTLAQMIATRRRVEDVTAACPDWPALHGFNVPGYVYDGEMVITIEPDVVGESCLHLVIFNEQWMEPNTPEGLEKQERRLYLFYVLEYIDLSRLVDRGAASDDLDAAVTPLQILIGQPDGGPASMFFSGPGREPKDWRELSSERRAELLTAYVNADVLYCTPARKPV